MAIQWDNEEQELSQDQMIPNSRLIETPEGYKAPQVKQRPTTQVVQPRDIYSKEVVTTPQVQRQQEVTEDYKRRAPNFETYRPLIDEMSQARRTDPEAMQKFLDNATPEDRAKLIGAINFNADYDVLGSEVERKVEAMDEPLGTGTEFDLLLTPLAGRMSKELLLGAADLYRMRGLTPALRRALQSGDEATLRRLIQEADLAKQSGIGDTIYKGGDRPYASLSDESTNLFEQRRFAESGQRIREEAAEGTARMLGSEKPMSETARVLQDTLGSELKRRKARVGAMYDTVESQASKDRLYDLSTLNQQLRQYTLDEGMDTEAVKSVLKLLEPTSGRALTIPQKEALKELKNTEKQLQRAKGLLNRQRTPANQRRVEQLQTRVNNLKQKTDAPDKYISENDMINVIRNLNKRMRTANINLPDDPNTNRILQGVKNRFMEGAEKQLEIQGQGDLLKNLREAGAAYQREVMPFSEIPEISMLSQGTGIGEEVTANLLRNPYRMKEALKLVDGTEAGVAMADQIVRQATRPVLQKIPGAKSTMDFTATANQLENLWKDPEMLAFMKKNLPADKFSQLEASKNIFSKVGPMFDELQKVPGWQEYISQGEGLPGKLGRSLETVYDFAGYLKNSTMGNVPGLKWTSSRIKATNDQVDRVIKIATKKLDELKQGKISPGEINQSLTQQEEEALDNFSDYFGGLVKTMGKKAGEAFEGSPFDLTPRMIPSNKSGNLRSWDELRKSGYGADDIAEYEARSGANYDYFSPSLDAIRNISETNLTPEALINRLRKAGVTPDEINTMGLSKILDKMPKDERGRVSVSGVEQWLDRYAGKELPWGPESTGYSRWVETDLLSTNLEDKKNLLLRQLDELESYDNPDISKEYLDNIRSDIRRANNLGDFNSIRGDIGEMIDLGYEGISETLIEDMIINSDPRKAIPKDYKVLMKEAPGRVPHTPHFYGRSEVYQSRMSKVPQEAIDEGMEPGVILQEIQRDTKTGPFEKIYDQKSIEDGLAEMRRQGENNLYIPIRQADGPLNAPTGMSYRTKGVTEELYNKKIPNTAKRVAKRYGLDYDIVQGVDNMFIKLSDPSKGQNKWHFPIYGKEGSFTATDQIEDQLK